MTTPTPHILDHSVWAVRPEVMATIKLMRAGGISAADMRRLLDDPQAAQARVRSQGPVDPEDLTRVGSVAVLSLSGIIRPNASLLSLLLFGSGGGLQQFRAELRAAMADDTVSAILLNVDSPGGSTALIQETAAEIRAAAAEKPIVAVANTVAASAAYHLASQATEFVATPSGYVGSIGVYMVHEDWSGLNEQMGIVVTYVYAGEFKIEGNPDQPLSDEARADWQRDVDAIHDIFVADVAAGRGVTEDVVREKFGKGRIMRAPDALAAGMINRVATFEETLAALTASTTTTLPATGAGGAGAQDDPPAPADADAGGKDPAAEAGGDPDPEAKPDPDPESESRSSGLTAADDFDVLAAI